MEPRKREAVICPIISIHRTTKSALNCREVSSISRSMGWIVLYDREFKKLAKIDSYLENLDMLKEYLAFYGIKW